ncbi:site-specific integrase [Phaeobacter gallaeciensis]|uniref:Site-specific integrase n=1 Tax=Phaeobacter gallaeciensis TaxID=60890 RepID=A0ABD4XDV1_9RHOB|nr:site-specific integrase [Phaeobacter gallaeciensis]MDE4146440.1 site-specific integrase [Phaeobacter gallaeciensis]MDE4159196.1 site-specific integrase [Phaeobacter gallaeciensis]MDE4163373.1 site-specific integrase [Phaeobacter gallaeciensis]MDE4167520.1 site-specific integrase [Phaeobacter gallaeciensis]MDE4171754.1 site-specific integrase [Phaeobacter gallaeciensis]
MDTLKYMKTIADMVHWIETDNPFTPAFQKKVLGSVRKMKKLPHYGVPLEQIPADLDAFDKTWGRGPVRQLPVGFKSTSSFSAWRSQVRSALTAFFGTAKPVATADPDDNWSKLMTDLETAGVPAKKLIAVTVLANAARQEALAPIKVSHSWLQGAVDTADTPGRHRSIKAASKLIHKHRNVLSVETSPDFGIPVQKSRTHCRRLALPEPLSTEAETWKQTRIQGERKGHRRKRKSACSPARAEQAMRGVTYVYRAMVDAKLLQPEQACSVSEMANPSLLEEVIERELNGKFDWEPLQPTTLFEYVNNWKLFVRGSGHDADALTEIISDFSEFENVKSMSTSRRDWCEAFLLDHHKQAVFFNLPNALFRKAKNAMQTYETGSQREKDTAIALGIAACAAAIWTSLPLRISTLLQLTYGGESADVQLHGSRRGLVLTTPPDIVKNGYSHHYITLLAKRGGDPREIVSWFAHEARPRLLAAHIAPHLRQPDRLFGGVSYARLSSIWQDATLSAGVPMTPHQVRHALATIMANQPGADYAIIAALLGDTEATVRKNYVFVDQARKHEEGQKLLAQIQSNVLMRGAA